MVCHETYKDKKGNWLYPEEIEKVSDNSAVKKIIKKMLLWAHLSLCQNQKNTIDPEIMIQNYGADAVRWFIMSDSPPEKDVQWSDTGVASSNKFLQRIWNLNIQIQTRKDGKVNKLVEKEFDTQINNLNIKIDKSIEEFKFNVAIAHFYEIYKIFTKYINLELSNKCLKNNIINTMKLMIPFTPHLSHECLEKLKCKSLNSWPDIKKNTLEIIKFAVQVNGKTRDIIDIKKNSKKEEINKIILKNSKAKKFIENREITKTIFVKDKIMNYIIK